MAAIEPLLIEPLESNARVASNGCLTGYDKHDHHHLPGIPVNTPNIAIESLNYVAVGGVGEEKQKHTSTHPKHSTFTPYEVEGGLLNSHCNYHRTAIPQDRL